MSKGTYARLDLHPHSANALGDWAARQNIPNAALRSHYHCTTMYSRIQVPMFSRVFGFPENAFKITDLAFFKNTKKDGEDFSYSLVALVDSPLAHWLHTLAMDQGATFDYPEYRPHITLSYNCKLQQHFNSSLSKLPTLFFSHEIVEELALEKTYGNTDNSNT